MKRLIEGSVRFRGLLIAAAVAVVIFGATQLQNAAIDSLPEFKETTVEVQTEALGLSAEEVEQFITVPLEQDLLNGIAFLEDIESASLPGLSSVVLTFEPGTDLLDARQVVNERLTQAVGVAGLPEVAQPPQMLQPLSSTNRAAIVRLSSSELSPIDISVLARWVIAPRLLGVEGVANVSTWGLRDRQLQVLVDSQELAAAGVTLNGVIRSAGNALEVSPLTFLEASKPGTGGFIDTTNQRLQIFHEQTIKTPEELALVPIEDEDGNAVFVDGEALTLGEVTTIVEDHQPLIGDALCSDGVCQLLVIEKFPGANTRAVAEGLEEALAAMRPGMAGLDMDTSIYRPADFVETSFANIRTAMIIGGVLALIVLAAIMFNWRSVLVTVLAGSASLATAVTVLLARGATLNLMIIAGLALAVLIVIDDAVVDVERLGGRLRHQDDKGEIPLTRRITAAVTPTRVSALYVLLIVGATVVPVLSMEGVAGAFLPPVVTTYVLAVAASLLVSVTLTPALSAILLNRAQPPPAGHAAHRIFDGWLSRLVGRPAGAFGVLALVVLGVISLAGLRPGLDPELRERDIVVQMEAAPGTSLIGMNEMTNDMVSRLAALEGVRTVGAHVGRAVMSDQVSNVNKAEVWISLDAAAPYADTVAAIEDVADHNPELVTSVLTHSQERVNELLRRTDHDIVVRVYGEDPAILDEKASEIEVLLRRIDGVENLRIDRQPSERTIQVITDLAAAQSVGVKPGDVRRTAAIMLNGITVGNLFEDQKVFDVVVWGRPELRTGEASLENLFVDTDDFGPIRLGTVADVAVVDAPAVIRHESVASYLDVTAGVVDRSIQDVADEVDTAISQVAFPLEHHAELLGSFEERRSLQVLVNGLWASAAIFILLLLQAGVGSWRLAAAVLGSLSVALAGGLLAIWITGGNVALGSVAGLFVVFAFAVRQGLLAINEYQSLRAQGLPFGMDLVVRGARNQMIPLFTTAAASILFFLPIALRGRSMGFEIVQPMAVVIIGGIVGSVLLVLFLLPWIYLRFGRAKVVSIWDDEEFDLAELAAVGVDE